MCMMIWHPRGAAEFTRAEFADFHRKNPHGFGVIYRAPNGTIRARKGMAPLNETWALYQRLIRSGVEEMALHWRFATAGSHGWDNCHPFKVRRDLWMMHNGVLNQCRSTRELSDTRCFIEDSLKPALRREPNLIDDPSAMRELGRWIGPGNRLLFWQLGAAEPVIVNDHHGVWWKGRWLANTYAWTIPPELRYSLDHGGRSRLQRSLVA